LRVLKQRGYASPVSHAIQMAIVCKGSYFWIVPGVLQSEGEQGEWVSTPRRPRRKI